MRRTLPFVALWFVAGAAAAGIATAGVAVVNDQLTGSRPAPLSAAEVRQQAGATPATSTTDTTERPTTTTTAPAGPTTTTSVGTSGTTGSTDGGGSGGPTPASPPATSAPAAAVTRTYELVGGTTTIRFAPSGITVLSATPKPGFAAKVEPEGAGKKVEFESDAHRSRIDAWWSGGPQTRIREDAD